MRILRFCTVGALLFLLLACGQTIGAADPQYEKTLQAAKKDGKPVMLYFWSQTCYYCKQMEKNTLADKEIGAILDKDFYLLRINVEKSPDLAKLYQVKGYPSSWFLESSGKRIIEAPGYIQKPLFKKILEYVKGNHYKNTDIHEYLKKKT